MLYGPGTIVQGVSTFVFYAVILIILGMAGTLYWQKEKIDELKKALVYHRAEIVELEGNNEFLKQNMNRLKEYYRKVIKPVMEEGKFNMNNLFPGPPK